MCLRTYTGEQQCSQSSIDNVQNPVLDDDAEQTEDDQNNETNEKHAVTGSEVVLGLREEAKSDIRVTSTSGCDQTMCLIYTHRRNSDIYKPAERKSPL